MQSQNAISAQVERSIHILGQLGVCGGREVFVGFASGSLLARVSFADVLDEATRSGYQRRFCQDHSLAFKRYIQQQGATTIPLTFNLREHMPARWGIERVGEHEGIARLKIDAAGPPAMAQVDCQHRLGYLRESPIVFAFMAFIGLSVEEEMRIFRDINGNAKGLSSSLIDYTTAKLAHEDLQVAHPAIALALRMHEDPESPWHNRLDLGGERTNGTKRIASLRTMQKAVRRFQKEAHAEKDDSATVGRWLIDFWRAVVRVYPRQWEQERKHLLAKGIGVYSLMSMAGILVAEAKVKARMVDQDYFIEKLSDFADRLDWTNTGPMQGFGGQGGADKALGLIKTVRAQTLRELNAKQEHLAH